MDFIKKALKFAVDAGKGILDDNSAYQIYLDLHNRLSTYDSVDNFLLDHPNIQKQYQKIIGDVRKHADHCDDANYHKENCHLLGSYLQEILAPRFVKEERKDPDGSKEEHVINWFKQNSKLIFSSDKDIVQSGFLAIFFV